VDVAEVVAVVEAEAEGVVVAEEDAKAMWCV
jgi:hypothetical protein